MSSMEKGDFLHGPARRHGGDVPGAEHKRFKIIRVREAERVKVSFVPNRDRRVVRRAQKPRASANLALRARQLRAGGRGGVFVCVCASAHDPLGLPEAGLEARRRHLAKPRAGEGRGKD